MGPHASLHENTLFAYLHIAQTPGQTRSTAGIATTLAVRLHT